jgi:hypothetical protein
LGYKTRSYWTGGPVGLGGACAVKRPSISALTKGSGGLYFIFYQKKSWICLGVVKLAPLFSWEAQLRRATAPLRALLQSAQSADRASERMVGVGVASPAKSSFPSGFFDYLPFTFSRQDPGRQSLKCNCNFAIRHTLCNFYETKT